MPFPDSVLPWIRIAVPDAKPFIYSRFSKNAELFISKRFISQIKTQTTGIIKCDGMKSCLF